ncbi:MAG: peptide chain release factor N(5)-glutamine methyltransferase [bacterium]|nr:peptide chain release factor N(5)-glutamine methyltransferase [bacterium]
MTIKEILIWSTKELKNNNVSEPEKSAELLLRQILNWDKAKLIANPDYKLNSAQESKFREFIERRKKHEPVWYITGKIEFYGLDLAVNQDVLIPRPETEFLVEEVLSVILTKEESKKRSFVPQDDIFRILELGTGSGAIALSLANKLKSKIFASDISKEALEVAKKNTKKLELEKYIEFRQGSLFEPWGSEKFDCFVANLPYIPHEDMSSLALDIHHFEPRLALDGGKEGLEIYEELLSQAGDYLNENAMMFFEIGIDQGDKLKKLVEKYLPKAKVRIIKDYGDIDRIAVIST